MKRLFALEISDKKSFFFSVVSIAKPKNFVMFAFTHVSKSSALPFGKFCIKVQKSVDSDEAVKC
jgi:hypothetical protein